MATLFIEQKQLLEDFRKLEIEIVTEEVKVRMANPSLQPTLLERVKKDQYESEDGKKLLDATKNESRKELRLANSGNIKFGNRLWVPSASRLRKEIMDEAHVSAYTIHPSSTKM